MMSFCCAAAAAGVFILHDLPLSASCLSLQSTKSIKLSPKREGERVRESESEASFCTQPGTHISPLLSVSRSSRWSSVMLWPHSSTVSVEQLVSIRPLLSLVHTQTHARTYTLKNSGAPCFPWLSALLKE